MRCLFILVMVFGLCSGGRSQSTVSGVVRDQRTGESLPGATIYLYELKKGTVADSTGAFKLSGLSSGQLLMEISYVGYKSVSFDIAIRKDTTLVINLRTAVIPLREVIVLGAQNRAETSFSIAQVSAADMAQMGTFSISDAMAKLPGMSQLSTGVGISKPVIRGLYGNRVQVNVNGLRFDNQQWQDEHGLGLSDVGIESIEVIKGPSSVLYGSDAMGGVLNIIEEKPAPVNTTLQNLVFKGFSNTFGASLQYGIKKSTERFWWKLRAGADSHADYSNPRNHRVLNSRFATYTVKAGMGFNQNNRSHAINLLLSSSKFGFVFDSISRKKEDPRVSRTFDGPHHQVLLAQLSSENTFFRSRKKIIVNGGLSTNLRQEDEGGGGISLSMLLNTASVLAQVNQSLGEHGEWIYGMSGLFQTNTNFGGRIIVPDAITGEFSLYTFLSQRWSRVLVEGGLRYDRKLIATYATGSVNMVGNEDSPTDDIVPFNNFYDALNVCLGTVFDISTMVHAKLNVSSGYRPGNLAELSSNGLHEGTLRWEIGLPDASIEQNLNTEFSLHYQSGHLRASASVYQNKFQNYIYLAPTGDEFFGFQIYRFQQDDAVFRGGEFQFTWASEQLPLELSSAYSHVYAKKSDGTYLPFVPANKINSSVTWHLKSTGSFQELSVVAGADYFLEQDRPSDFETTTPSYWLFRAGITTRVHAWNVSLSGNNLFNKVYFDHLSRFKYFGIYNMGRNITLTLIYNF